MSDNPQPPAPQALPQMQRRQPASEPVNSSDTVTIACKLPAGLRLRRFVERVITEVGPVVSRDVKQYFPTGEEFVVRGTAVLGTVSRESAAAMFPGGYALSPGCPRELWENWLAANRNSKLVQNRLVFACGDDWAAREQASDPDNAKTKSGLEPIDPEQPFRWQSRSERLRLERGQR